MSKKPANLTEIAKRNGGLSTHLISSSGRSTDGNRCVATAAPTCRCGAMRFKSREAGDAERVKAVIQSLVDYLDSIQVRLTQNH